MLYISHKKTVGAALAQTAHIQVTEDEAKNIVEVDLMLRSYTHQQYLGEPVPKLLLMFLDVLLQGVSSIEVKEDVSNARVRVAHIITYLICSNIAKESSRSDKVVHMHARETPFLCMWG